MRESFVAMTFLGALAITSAPSARAGQCYTAEGRSTGPTYENAAPDREWIHFVTMRGGHCTGLSDETAGPPRLTKHEMPNHRHLQLFKEMQRR